jgi:polysaccharide biosynthesis transport protein
VSRPLYTPKSGFKHLNSDNATLQPIMPTPLSDSQVGMVEIFRILRRGKWIILSSILASVFASWVYTARLPRIYTATARIDIGLNQASSLRLEEASQSSGASEQKLQTQLGILKSQSLAWDVISRLRLYADPDFMASSGPFVQDSVAISNADHVALVSRFLSSLDVQFERGTEIAQIQYRSTSPSFAAKIANEISDAYINRNFQSKYATTLKATTWLNGQLDGLRKAVIEADKRFADFQQKTGILQTDETHNPNLDRLLQLDTALGSAQAQRILKEDIYRASATSEPDQLLPATAFPALQSLRTQKATLDGDYALLSAKYGDAYPRVNQLKSQMAQIQAAIDKEVARARRQIETDYLTALSNERSLSAAADQQKQVIFSLNQNALQYTILQRQVLSSRSLYEDLVKRLQEAGITSGLSADAIAVIDEALPPVYPTSPRKGLNIEVGFVIGLVLGIGISLLLELISSSIRSVEDIRLTSGLPSLGIIPHASSLKSLDGRPERNRRFARSQLPFRITEDPQSKFAEAFRGLRSSLLLSSAGEPPKIVLVCSSWPSEGKSTAAINLATVLAQAGKRVLLVDADLRRPSIRSYYGITTHTIGLSEILTGEKNDTDKFLYPDTAVPNLQLLTSGKIPPSSSELLMSARMASLLEEWRLVYDFIVLDSAPILAVSDALFLASAADAVVVVVRAGSTPKKSLRVLKDSISHVRGKIAGVLLNDVTEASGAYYAYYGGNRGRYGYYSSSEDE